MSFDKNLTVLASWIYLKIIFTVLMSPILFFSLAFAADSRNVNLIGSLSGGLAKNVMVKDNYAYVAAGAALYIINVSNPADLTLASRCPTPGYAKKVVVENQYAYIADTDEGLRIIDVSNPFSPWEVGFCELPGKVNAVVVAGQYAYIANNNNNLQVVNINDPHYPTLVGSCAMYSDPFIYYTWANCLAIKGNLAYVGTNLGLRVIDISNPTSPTEITTYGNMSIDDLILDGNYAYLAGDDFIVLDISSSSAIHEEDSISSLPTSQGISLKNKLVYMADALGRIHVIDVTQPAVLDLWPDIIEPACPYDVEISGDFLYVADGKGLRSYDISNPTMVSGAGNYDISYGWSNNIAVSGKYAYLTDGYNGTHVIDINNPASPVEAHSNSIPGYATAVALSGNYAFVADLFNSGLQVLDITIPNQSHIVSYINLPATPVSISISGVYAYLALSNVGLGIIDISNPEAPCLTTTFSTQGTVWDVRIRDNYAYLADDSKGLIILDITNAPLVREIGRYSGHYRYIAVRGDYVLANGSLNVSNIINVSNPGVPILASEFGKWEDTAHGITANGNYAYVAYFDQGLYILDIGNLNNITETGYYDSAGLVETVVLDGKYIYTAEQGSGLNIYEYLPPTPTPAPGLSDVKLEDGAILPFPNPAKHEVKFLMHLKEPTSVMVVIYNLAGEKISELNESLPTGRGQFVTWKSENAGVYIARIRMNGKWMKPIKFAMIH